MNRWRWVCWVTFHSIYIKNQSQFKNLTNRGRNLGILDFFGFESYETNNFEQLNINYCNERIHQSYIQIVLKYQQDLYVREGLEWTKIDFYDNQSICEMMDKVRMHFKHRIEQSNHVCWFSASVRNLLSHGRAESCERWVSAAAPWAVLVGPHELLHSRPRSA